MKRNQQNPICDTKILHIWKQVPVSIIKKIGFRTHYLHYLDFCCTYIHTHRHTQIPDIYYEIPELHINTSSTLSSHWEFRITNNPWKHRCHPQSDQSNWHPWLGLLSKPILRLKFVSMLQLSSTGLLFMMQSWVQEVQ